MAKAFRSLKEAEKFLFKAIANSEEDKVCQWVNHFESYFPPLLSEYVEVISDTLTNPNKKARLLVGNGTSTPGRIYISPEKVHSIVMSDPEVKKRVFGHKRDHFKNTNNTLLIYSAKLDSRFVSSQESAYPLLIELSKRIECIFAYPKSSPASNKYLCLGKSLEINDESLNSEAMSISQLQQINPGAAIFFTPHKKITNELKDTKIFDIFFDGTEFRGQRPPDFALSLGTAHRSRFPDQNPIYTSETEFALPAPQSGIHRKYTPKIIQGQKKNEVNFGAFCRLAKLDISTLEVWAQLLNAIDHSTLTFAYLGTTPIAEHYLRSYFETRNINAHRIKVLPRMNTNNYLKYLSDMDIILGASPEQGGISCLDALASAVPFITYAGNSVTTTAIKITEGLNMSYFNTYSTPDFIDTVKQFIKTGFPNDPKKNAEIMNTYMQKSRRDFLDKTLIGLQHALSS